MLCPKTTYLTPPPPSHTISSGMYLRNTVNLAMGYPDRLITVISSWEGDMWYHRYITFPDSQAGWVQDMACGSKLIKIRPLTRSGFSICVLNSRHKQLIIVLWVISQFSHLFKNQNSFRCVPMTTSIHHTTHSISSENIGSSSYPQADKVGQPVQVHICIMRVRG